MPSQNREQRRAAKFGRHRSADQGPWPESAPNPALGGTGSTPIPSGDEGAASQPTQDPTAVTGSGTGGATKTTSAKG
jgi:hypothetical protein